MGVAWAEVLAGRQPPASIVGARAAPRAAQSAFGSVPTRTPGGPSAHEQSRTAVPQNRPGRRGRRGAWWAPMVTAGRGAGPRRPRQARPVDNHAWTTYPTGAPAPQGHPRRRRRAARRGDRRPRRHAPTTRTRTPARRPPGSTRPGRPPSTGSRVPATEVIASWNAHTPAGTWLQIELHGTYSDGSGTPWYVMGRWAAGDQDIKRTSVDDQTRRQEHASGRTPSPSTTRRPACAWSRTGCASPSTASPAPSSPPPCGGSARWAPTSRTASPSRPPRPASPRS